MEEEEKDGEGIRESESSVFISNSPGPKYWTLSKTFQEYEQIKNMAFNVSSLVFLQHGTGAKVKGGGH